MDSLVPFGMEVTVVPTSTKILISCDRAKANLNGTEN